MNVSHSNKLTIDRRQLLLGGAGAFAANLLPELSLAANPTDQQLHGISAFGELKYGSDFSHFDYANLNAPKGGIFRFQPPNWGYNQNALTFNTLNSFVLKGEAPPRMELCFDTLMVWAIDEPDALYCALAEWVEISTDRNTYRFKLRENARFHDGTPITAHDAAFSYMTIKADGHPQLSLALGDLDEAVANGNLEVELRFNGKQTDHAILTVTQSVPILSKAYYSKQEFNASSITPPLGSGPYKVGRFEVGKYIEYERVADYWANDLAFVRGLYHFQTIRIDFFRDRTSGFEAFKKGNIEFREEFTSKVWATEYNFPAVSDARVKQLLLPSEKIPAIQAWALNSRRKKLADVKTREAIGLCFDFEWTNENLFFGAYSRSQSIFEQSKYKATGKPSQEELVVLNDLQKNSEHAIAPQVMNEILLQPVSDGSGQIRNHLKMAIKLLIEAGWKRRDGLLVDKEGNPFTLEFLINTPALERLHGKFVDNLKVIGIDASIRLVDASQYQSREENFDFDIIMVTSSFAPTPTAESLKQLLSSSIADRTGSRNYPGLRSKAIDGLLSRMKQVENQEELVTLLRVIDRVLRPMHLWIPNWYSANHRLAFWDIYGRSENKPDYSFPVEQLWWFDEDKAKAIGKT